MSVALNAVGGLEVFARGRDNGLWHRWQTAGGWSDWESRGGDLRGGPAVARHAGGGLEVFAQTPDGALWHIWQKTFTEWSEWKPMGIRFTGNPAVGMGSGRNPANGAMCVFVAGVDGTLQFSHQQAAADSTSWSPFRRIAGPIASDVSIARSPDGRNELFYADDTGAMRHVFQLSDDTFNWSDAGSFGGVLRDRPAAIRNVDDRLEVFHRGHDGRLHNAFQTAPNNGWSGWNARELTGSARFPVVARNGDGRLEVFALDDGTGNVLHMWQDKPAGDPWYAGSLGGERLGGISGGLAELGRCALWETGWM